MPRTRRRAGYSISFPETMSRAKGAMGLPAPEGWTQPEVDADWQRVGPAVMAVAHLFHA